MFAMPALGSLVNPVTLVASPSLPTPPKATDEDSRSDSTVSGALSEPPSLPPSPSEVDLVSEREAQEGAVSLLSLPSLGSIGHSSGNCSRCCFHPKGRCTNGFNCRFCHFDHEKRRGKKAQALQSMKAPKLSSSPAGVPLQTLDATPTSSSGPCIVPPRVLAGKLAAEDSRSESTASGGISEAPSLPPSPSEDAFLSPQSADAASLLCLPAGLPSLGSVGHFSGNCSRCCFHPKGRCENGFNCRFCHYDHEKRRGKKKIEAKKTMMMAAIPSSSSPHPLQMSEGFSSALPLSDVSSGDSVTTWLTTLGLHHCVEAFRAHRITDDVLCELDDQDLTEIGVKAVGDRKRILRAVAQLNAVSVPAVLPAQIQGWPASSSSMSSPPAFPSPVYSPTELYQRGTPGLMSPATTLALPTQHLGASLKPQFCSELPFFVAPPPVHSPSLPSNFNSQQFGHETIGQSC